VLGIKVLADISDEKLGNPEGTLALACIAGEWDEGTALPFAMLDIREAARILKRWDGRSTYVTMYGHNVPVRELR